MPLVGSKGVLSSQGFGEFAKQGAAPIYIEDVYSNYRYTANGGTLSIVNNINLSGSGGMVWIKNLSNQYHGVWDTVRGPALNSTGNNKAFCTNRTDLEGLGGVNADYINAFNSNGFTVVYNNNASSFYLLANSTAWGDYTSYTFRKQPKFFDIVTWSGNGAVQTISHNLGSVPGMIITKEINANGNWVTYHKTVGNTKYLSFNLTDLPVVNANVWNNTSPTSTNFTVGTSWSVVGRNYIAYLFADNAGGFGDSGAENVITCDSFTTDASGAATVNLGYEPQFLLTKNIQTADNWNSYSQSNIWSWNAVDQIKPNTNLNSQPSGLTIIPTATGFQIYNALAYTANNTYVYMAIRKGPMKKASAGTDVFNIVARTGNSTSGAIVSTTKYPDLGIIKARTTATTLNTFTDRLRGFGRQIYSESTGAEANATTTGLWVFYNTSVKLGNSANVNSSSYTYINYFLTQSPGFFNIVCYTGNGALTTLNHGLKVAPELMIFKSRSAATGWPVYHASLGNQKAIYFNTTAASVTDSTYWNNTNPTSSVFTVNTNADINTNAATYVAYLFATQAGVSKVGSYTGTGTTLQIDCGFTSGARFVMIKRADSTGDWYYWDSTRGISATNDPYLLFNSSAAEVTTTDYVDPYSPGFEISSTAPAAINASGGTFIYFAVA